MKMQPFLSDALQVFSFDLLVQLQLAGFTKQTEKLEWGKDRIVTLRHRDTPVKRQWNGTCTSFATIAAIENKLGGQIHLSERSLWDYYGVYSTEQAIKSASIHFVMEETYWPEHQQVLDVRFRNKGRYQLAKFSYLASEYLDVLKAIDKGNPCVVALSTPKDLISFKPQVEATSRILKRSGHAICVCGYKVENGKGYFLVKNSWGTECGDNGYQFVAFEVFDNKGYSVFWELEEIIDRGEQKFSFTFDQDLLLDTESHFIPVTKIGS